VGVVHSIISRVLARNCDYRTLVQPIDYFVLPYIWINGCKSTMALTPSMRSALQDLKLKSLIVVHAGNETFPLSKQVQAVAIDDLLKIVKSLR
jgi:hypothetical protein